MQVSAISQANTLSNKRNLSPNSSINVNFQGVLGTKLLNKLSETNNLEKSEVFDAMKGIFGFKKNRVKDVVEEFLREIKELRQEIVAITNGKNAKLAEVERLYNEKLNNSLLGEKQLNNTLQFKNEKIQQLTAEVEKLTKANKKYSLMANVKSVNEIGALTESQLINVLKESYEKLGIARKSMYEFLTTGKGQEEALAQAERANVILKAYKDGMMNNPVIVRKCNEFNKNNISVSYTAEESLKSLIRGALIGAPDSSWMYSNAVQKQMTENAKAIILPHMNERYADYKMLEAEKIKVLDQEIPELIYDTIKLRKMFENGLNYIQTSAPQKNMKNIELYKCEEFIPESIKLVAHDNDVALNYDYASIINLGNRHK